MFYPLSSVFNMQSEIPACGRQINQSLGIIYSALRIPKSALCSHNASIHNDGLAGDIA
jgi:hypothetical protein